MWARATRIEFIIVSVALLVLLVCSKPPQPGNADVGDVPDSISPPEWSPENPASNQGDEASGTSSALGETVPTESTEPDEEASDSLDTASDPLPPEQTRVATVDARSCNSLDYGDVMVGTVTVRWVWNGTKFVPHKVCVVKEKNGVSSVWSFDQQEEASLSEVPPEKD